MTALDMTALPTTAAGLGIPPGMLQDLVLRRALLDGHTSTLRLSEALAVSPQVMDQVVDELRDLRLLEVEGLERRSYALHLTEAGTERAVERTALCHYAGAAPVSLPAYAAVARAQLPPHDVDHERMAAALADLVVDDALIDRLGPALRARGAMFLHGPAGTGKTSIAERLVRAMGDVPLLIPHAIAVEGQLVTVLDPVVHHPLPEQPPGLDPRWVACHRPLVLAGGELTLSQLDLRYDATSGVHRAPLQVQANGGVLVIDDFGRQTVSPDALLNRWIVPLDRGVDHLTLVDGTTFPVPCTPKIVFSTNLAPASLGDEAFYRRIRSKILVPPMTDEQFDEVLRRTTGQRGVAVAPGAAERLRTLARRQGDGDLRPYLPVAVCDLVESICDYDGTARTLDVPTVDRVMDLLLTQAVDRPDDPLAAAVPAGAG